MAPRSRIIRGSLISSQEKCGQRRRDLLLQGRFTATVVRHAAEIQSVELTPVGAQELKLSEIEPEGARQPAAALLKQYGEFRGAEGPLVRSAGQKFSRSQRAECPSADCEDLQPLPIR